MTKAWPKPAIQNLPDQVAHTILQMIASGELRAGDWLPSQRDLAENMGVGLAVIREAVQRLAALNIVEASHGSGTVIRQFSWTPLIYDSALFGMASEQIGRRDLWETRRLLEGQIIRLAVQRATHKDLDAMRAVLAHATPLPANYAASQTLNRDFHLALAHASHNAMLEDLVTPLIEVRTQGAERRFTRDHCRRTWQAHEAICHAVVARDLDAADRAIIAHFEVGTVALADQPRTRIPSVPRRHITAPRRRKGATP